MTDLPTLLRHLAPERQPGTYVLTTVRKPGGVILRVHSDLAAEGISCNVVAGYHHDHVFVDEERAEVALAVLRRLSDRSDRLPD